MDELEISGKRYISSRRAGKENKYHADYIGQLIRAKKVEGQKVGRAWYVDADSLAAYLGKEAPSRISPHLIAHVEEKVAAPIIEIPLEKEEIPEATPEIISEAKKDEASAAPIGLHNEALPIFYKTTREAHEARGGLRYITDEGPLIPQVQKIYQVQEEQNNIIPIRHAAAAPLITKIHQPEAWAIPKRAAEVRMETILERPTYKEASVKSKRESAPILARGAVVLVLGALVFAVAALASTHLLFTVTVNGEQSASAGYSIK